MLMQTGEERNSLRTAHAFCLGQANRWAARPGSWPFHGADRLLSRQLRNCSYAPVLGLAFEKVSPAARIRGPRCPLRHP